MQKRHAFHLVDPSPWPLVMSGSLLALTSGGVMYFQSYELGGVILSVGFVMVLVTMFIWFRDVVREGTFQGHHTKVVQQGLRYGMILFISSEVMFFFAFFWAFFHASLAPTVELGSVWPPEGINVLKPFEIPFLNTCILLFSGVTVTWAHHAIVAGSRSQALAGLTSTVLLGFIFTVLQAFEYIEASFTISDSVYGSCFYMATGFHGLHVLVGTTFLLICLYRLSKHHFTRQHHFGFEAAAWYWHFVDVVWLFLFVVVYWWGNS